jgi:hypothetical protein
VTITAVDPVVADVMFVAEGYGLIFDYFDVRDVVTTVHRVGDSNQSADCEDSARNTYFRDAICASVEKLGHPVRPV